MHFNFLKSACVGKQSRINFGLWRNGPKKEPDYVYTAKRTDNPPPPLCTATYPNKIKSRLRQTNTDPVFFFAHRESGAAHFFLPAVNTGRTRKNGDAECRTLIPTHDALSGTVAKKERQCTAAHTVSITLV